MIYFVRLNHQNFYFCNIKSTYIRIYFHCRDWSYASEKIKIHMIAIWILPRTLCVIFIFEIRATYSPSIQRFIPNSQDICKKNNLYVKYMTTTHNKLPYSVFKLLSVCEYIAKTFICRHKIHKAARGSLKDLATFKVAVKLFGLWTMS